MRASSNPEAAAPTPASASQRAGAWAYIAFAVVAVTGMAALAFLGHRHQRSEELKEEYARTVAHVGRQIELRYDNYRQIVGSITSALTPNARQPNLLPSYGPDVEECTRRDADHRDLCVARRLAHAAEADTQGLSMVGCDASAAAAATPSVIRDEGELAIVFPAARPGGVCGRVGMDWILGTPIAKRAAPAYDDPVGAFDDLLLLADDGTVLQAAKPGSALRVVSFAGFDPNQPLASRVLANVALGATVFTAFVQPVAIRVNVPCRAGALCPAQPGVSGASGQTRGATLLLCGLVRQDRLQQESDRVSPAFFLFGLLVVGLGILALPVAKLWLVGARSRFTRFDVALLVVSAIAATLLSTVSLFAVVARDRLSSRLDDQLEDVTKSVSEMLQDRIQRAGTALADFNEQTRSVRQALANDALREATECSTSALACFFPSWLPACQGALSAIPQDKTEGTGHRDPVCELTECPQPDGVTLAFWANASGYEQIKEVPGLHATNPISVDRRAYFRRALAAETKMGLSSDETPWRPDCSSCVEEVVRSATSGQIVLVVARPTYAGPTELDAPDEDGTRPTGVAAVEMKLPAFEEPVFPLGFQAAVVDRDGQVMIHSNNEAHQGQNIFDDIRDPSALRAAMVPGAPAGIDLFYLGVSSRARVARLNGLDWYVVTMARTDLVDIPVATMVLVSLLGFCALAVLAVVVGGLVLFLRRACLSSPRRALLRPDARRAVGYAHLAQRMIAATVAIGCLVLFGIRVLPLAVFLGLAIAAACWSVASLIALSEDGPQRVPAGVEERTRPWYACIVARSRPGAAPWRTYLPMAFALCCFGLAGVGVVAPTTVLFAGAYDYAVECLVRAEQESEAKRVGYEVNCLRSPCLSRPWVVQKLGSSDAESQAPADSWWRPRLWPLPTLSQLLPALSIGELDSLLGLYETRSDSTDRDGVHLPEDRAWVRRPHDLDLLPFPGATGQAVRSSVPKLVRGCDLQKRAPVLFAFFVALGFAHVAAYWSMRRLLFLPLSARLARAEPGTVDRVIPKEGERLIILRPPGGSADALRSRGFIEIANAVAGPPPEAQNFVFVPSLEAILASPLALGRLEALVDAHATVVLLSQVDPIFQTPAALRGAWAKVLENFEVRAFRPRVEPRLVGEAATSAACFRAWSRSDADEKRILSQIAIDGFACPHPMNEPILERLCARGLISCETMKLASDEFAAFIRRSSSIAELQAWQDMEGGSGWTLLRVPLATGVAALIAALSASRPELGATGAVPPTVAVAMAALAKVLTARSADKSG